MSECQVHLVFKLRQTQTAFISICVVQLHYFIELKVELIGSDHCGSIFTASFAASFEATR